MDDKKKLMVLGAMAVVLLGIGVMQFTKGSGAPAPAPAATTASSATSGSGSGSASTASNATDTLASQQNDLVKGAYAYHDPFKPVVDPNAQAAPAQPNPQPQVGNRNSGIPNFPGIDKQGSLPPATVASANGGTTVPVNPPAPAFGYRLAGVILGRKPAAVFIDAQNAQHLVQIGGSLDGDTQLVSLDRDHVVLRVKGQDKNLTLGGDSSAK